MSWVSGCHLLIEGLCWHSGVGWSVHWNVYIANIWFLFLTLPSPPPYSLQTLVCLPAAGMEMWRKFPSTCVICGTKCHCVNCAGLLCCPLWVPCGPLGGEGGLSSLYFCEAVKVFQQGTKRQPGMERSESCTGASKSFLPQKKGNPCLIPVLVLPENSNVWLSFTMQGSVLLQCRNWESTFSSSKENFCKTALLILANKKIKGLVSSGGDSCQYKGMD